MIDFFAERELCVGNTYLNLSERYAVVSAGDETVSGNG